MPRRYRLNEIAGLAEDEEDEAATDTRIAQRVRNISRGDADDERFADSMEDLQEVLESEDNEVVEELRETVSLTEDEVQAVLDEPVETHQERITREQDENQRALIMAEMRLGRVLDARLTRAADRLGILVPHPQRHPGADLPVSPGARVHMPHQNPTTTLTETRARVAASRRNTGQPPHEYGTISEDSIQGETSMPTATRPAPVAEPEDILDEVSDTAAEETAPPDLDAARLAVRRTVLAANFNPDRQRTYAERISNQTGGVRVSSIISMFRSAIQQRDAGTLTRDTLRASTGRTPVAARPASNGNGANGTARAPRVEVEPTECMCGCGEMAGKGSRFRPGHDARLYGRVIRLRKWVAAGNPASTFDDIRAIPIGYVNGEISMPEKYEQRALATPTR